MAADRLGAAPLTPRDDQTGVMCPPTRGAVMCAVQTPAEAEPGFTTAGANRNAGHPAITETDGPGGIAMAALLPPARIVGAGISTLQIGAVVDALEAYGETCSN